MRRGDQKQRLFAGLVQDLRERISKGHPVFSADQISTLVEYGHSFEPRRIRYLLGASGKCLEIAHKNLLKHGDWSLWMGFVLNGEYWSAHAWNRTPRGWFIEPNARLGQVQLYYGFEAATGPKELARRGLSANKIKEFDAYTNPLAFPLRSERSKTKAKQHR